jgi:hypothetical protein
MRRKALPPTISAETVGVGGERAVTCDDTFVGRAGSAAAGAAVRTMAPIPTPHAISSRTPPGSPPGAMDASPRLS